MLSVFQVFVDFAVVKKLLLNFAMKFVILQLQTLTFTFNARYI